MYTIETAVVITVFKQSAAISQMPFSTSPLSGPAFTGSIKYDIDSTLINKAWERVKKNAAKIIKKETVRQKDRNDNDVMSGASGVSTSV